MHKVDDFSCFVQARMYRVKWLFDYMNYELTISLLWGTMIRNLVVNALNPSPKL